MALTYSSEVSISLVTLTFRLTSEVFTGIVCLSVSSVFPEAVLATTDLSVPGDVMSHGVCMFPVLVVLRAFRFHVARCHFFTQN